MEIPHLFDVNRLDSLYAFFKAGRVADIVFGPWVGVAFNRLAGQSSRFSAGRFQIGDHGLLIFLQLVLGEVCVAQHVQRQSNGFGQVLAVGGQAQVQTTIGAAGAELGLHGGELIRNLFAVQFLGAGAQQAGGGCSGSGLVLELIW